MNRQRGVSLSGLLVAAVLLALVALLGMKVVPEVIEYFQIVKTVKAIKSDPGATTSVVEVRKAFDRHADINNIKAITAQDLEVTKDGSEVVISFSYERRVHLFGNVSLLLDFEGSSAGG
jgi:hypothetical protein